MSEMARQAAISLRDYLAIRGLKDGETERAFFRFEAAIRADERERCAKVADVWQSRWAEDHKRFDDQFWEAGAAVADQIATDIRTSPEIGREE